jgi:hypothetical protein
MVGDAIIRLTGKSTFEHKLSKAHITVVPPSYPSRRGKKFNK